MRLVYSKYFKMPSIKPELNGINIVNNHRNMTTCKLLYYVTYGFVPKVMSLSLPWLASLSLPISSAADVKKHGHLLIKFVIMVRAELRRNLFTTHTLFHTHVGL